MTDILPVFIFGYTHSGTSLLQGILRRHPDVFSQRSETSFYQFPHFYMTRFPTLDSVDAIHGMILFCANLITKGNRQLFGTKTESIDPTLLSPDELEIIRRRLPELPSHRECFPATFTYLAEKAGKRVWVEKTPDHTQQAKRLLSELPDAKAIEIVRDARDILSSKKVREKGIKQKLRSGELTDLDRVLLGYADYDVFWNGLGWRSSVRAVNHARSAFPERILTLRYEDLTASPERTVRQVCEFLGLEFTPGMLDADQENVADLHKDDRRAGAGILSTSVGRYHTTLSRGEKALANRLLHAELRQHGYAVPTISLGDRLLSVLILVRSLPNLMVRIFHKLKYRGFAHTLDRLKAYLQRMLPQHD